MLTLKAPTLLHVAAECGQLEIAKLLTGAGANIDAPALMYADGQGGQTQTSMLQRRIATSASKWFISSFQQTPM